MTVTLFQSLGRLGLLLSLAIGCWAQVDRATLSGAVSDSTGAVVDNAKILIESSSTGFRRETLTGSDGSYRFPGLPVGSFTVSISKAGFNTVKFDQVTLAVGQSRTLNATVTVGAISTSMEVIAGANPVEQTNAEIGTVIGEQQIKNIPLNGRHWASLMLLAPGAVNVGEGNQNSIRFFGRPRDDNNWTFDGVDAIEGPIVVVAWTAKEANGILIAFANIHGTRGEQHQRCPMAAIERDVLDLLFTDDGSDLSVGLFHWICTGDHFHRGGNRTHRDGRIQRARLADGESDLIELDGIETGFRNGDGERSDRQARKAIASVRSRQRLATESGGARFDQNFRVIYNGTRGIADRAA